MTISPGLMASRAPVPGPLWDWPAAGLTTMEWRPCICAKPESFRLPPKKKRKKKKRNSDRRPPHSNSQACLRPGAGMAFFFRCPSLTNALLQLGHHVAEVRITCSEAPREPVPAAVGNRLSIGEHLKLPRLARCNHGLYPEPLLDHGRETRGLGLIARSRRTGSYLNLHFVLRFLKGILFLPVLIMCRYRLLFCLASLPSRGPPVVFCRAAALTHGKIGRA